jgi:hypothetical protein
MIPYIARNGTAMTAVIISYIRPTENAVFIGARISPITVMAP